MKKSVSRKGCLATPGFRHLARKIRRRNGEITSYVLNRTQNGAQNVLLCFGSQKHESIEKSAQSGN